MLPSLFVLRLLADSPGELPPTCLTPVTILANSCSKLGCFPIGLAGWQGRWLPGIRSLWELSMFFYPALAHV